MTDDGQTGLAEFGLGEDDSSSSDDERDLAAEARAVAGDGDGSGIETIDPTRDGLDARYGEPAETIRLSVMQIDYTIAGRGQHERPIINVFGRDEDDDPHHVRVLGFQPYFYAPTDTLERPPEEEYDGLVDSDETDENGEPFESIRGEHLTKIYGRTPRDVGEVRDEFDHYEADILFPNRFLIDKDIQSGVEVPVRRDEEGALIVAHEEVEAAEMTATPRVNTFDLEVDDRHGFPEPEDAEQPIICLASHDSYDDEYILWLYDAPVGGVDAPDALEGYDPLTDEADYEVRTFDSEEALLEAFLDYLGDTDPDVLTGWNFEDFDAPYLVNRLENLGLSYDRLSRVGEVWAGGWGGPDIKGRVVFDLLYAYKRTQFTELESYRLDAVGEQELGVGKERYTGDIGDLWEDDPEQLLEYNLRDVELCVELDRKQNIVEFWDEVRTFVGCKLEDAPTPGDAVDMYVLHKVHGNFSLPSKGKHEGEDYEGGAVFDPITGVKENVTVLDLKSLYPMCMVTTNASPETKVDPDEYGDETYRAPNGTHFRKEPDGIIREMVDELLTERENKKELRNEHDPDSEAYARYDQQQGAVKVIMNSLYGVLGWDRFRLYDKEMGAAVTATGREVIEFTEEAANELDYDVTYGDSVTGDRPIVVRDPTGAVRIRPIEELFETGSDLDAAGEVLISADGGTVATATTGKDRRTLDGWEALSLSETGEAEWQPIEGVIRHETDKPVCRLQHKFGESTVTRDHSFVVEDDGKYVEAKPEDVDEPLRVPTVPSVEPIETIDVYEVLDGYVREYEDGRSVGSENAISKTKRIHADDNRVWFGHEHHDDVESTISVQRHIDIDSEDGRALVRLLAAYISEGSASTVETTEAKFGASVAESRREWLEGLQDDYRRLFEGATAGITASDSRDERAIASDDGDDYVYDDGTLKLQMMNELSAVFFREFAGQSSRGKRIPSFVFHLPSELQDLFIDVLVEGDGSREFPRYSEGYCERNFDYETVSRELAAGLSMLLTQRGRKHSLKYRSEKGSYTIRTCEFYRSGREPVVREVEHDGYVYDLSVAENENFVDGVGGVVLHNTDSVMLELGPDIETDDAIEQSFEIEEHINSAYDRFARDELNAAEHRFQIEFEKLYRRFFQAGKKKRYAGHIVWKEGKDVDDIDITGFEYQRSDIAQITKEVQLEVITRIVRGEDIEDVKTYVHDIIQEVQAGEVSLDEIGIPGGIGKKLDNYDTDTAQVRGAKYANELLGTNFSSGSKPKRLYLKKVHPSFFERMEREEGFDPQTDLLYGEFKRDPDVICFEYDDQIPEEFEIDYEKMLDKTLKGPIERVLEALDISWSEVKSGQEQTGLGGFM
ncbi:DNA polymerase domain-containing protein [Natranaeroarchaeum sulfidigenes]|uniref:DNA polymerase n=1 Tax=Natranaeroarchaeum sulfidigenes TaxID=2784880 RepID=A0A897MNC8_9EURY|nr:DNA polymerase domain-containing protein [Natranaeroarchaeum sulfidigenes]QSG02084.1 DNA polymerase PolB3 [Natranaeroarchaeum sulfidigenes]